MTLVPESTKLRKALELFDERFSVGERLQDDEIGSGRRAVSLYGGGDAAHMHFDMRLAHTPVARRVLDHTRDLLRLAKGLNGDARHGSDLTRAFAPFVCTEVSLIIHPRQRC